MEAAIKFRREIHQFPELSGLEAETAKRVLQFFQPLNPDLTITNLGGHGLAFVFGQSVGPTVLLRCELDALPIKEENEFSYRSESPFISHKCGHDGHMAILSAVGMRLSKQRPTKGRVVLLFQPAEEVGSGSSAVISDPQFQTIKPDFAFALHNLPGFPFGQIVLRHGVFACASRGMSISLKGKTAHAAQPDTGISPAPAMCQVISELEKKTFHTQPGRRNCLDNFHWRKSRGKGLRYYAWSS